MDTTRAPQPHTLGLFSGQTTIGAAASPGSCVYDDEGQVYAITGAGANIWGQRDDFHFVWRRVAGDFILTFRGAFAGEVFEAPNWTTDSAALIFNRNGRLERFDLAERNPTPIDTGDVVRNNNDHVLSFDL